MGLDGTSKGSLLEGGERERAKDGGRDYVAEEFDDDRRKDGCAEV